MSTSGGPLVDDAELDALAKGKLAAQTVSRLTAVELGKHRVLIEAVRRRALVCKPADRIFFDAAVQLLSDVESVSPAVVASVLSMPQIGYWAVSCLRRLARDDYDRHQGRLRNDLGYLAGVAAVAALRASYPFELEVPLRDGLLMLPGMMAVDIGSVDRWAVARVWLDHEGSGVIFDEQPITLSKFAGRKTCRIGADVSLTLRLHAEADGMALDVVLDDADPFLAPLRDSAIYLSAADRGRWQQHVSTAWSLLVRHHRVAADAFGAVVSTFVPLAVSPTVRSRSVTCGWTHGAMGLSLPGDDVSLAEIFVHELHHLVLGAVEDVVTLVDGDSDDRLVYAPWRDDSRPVWGLFHGCYAHLGITAFWKHRRHLGGSAERFRADVEFARWRRATLEACGVLARSPALTEAGRRFSTGIRGQLAEWQADPVSIAAERVAAERRAEHRARWLLANQHADGAQVMR